MQGGEGGSVTPLEGDCGPSHTPEPSYLDYDILKQLRRELDQEVIDSEFDVKVLKQREMWFCDLYKTKYSSLTYMFKFKLKPKEYKIRCF